jgi:hypothetical protein
VDRPGFVGGPFSAGRRLRLVIVLLRGRFRIRPVRAPGSKLTCSSDWRRWWRPFRGQPSDFGSDAQVLRRAVMRLSRLANLERNLATGGARLAATGGTHCDEAITLSSDFRRLSLDSGGTRGTHWDGGILLRIRRLGVRIPPSAQKCLSVAGTPVNRHGWVFASGVAELLGALYRRGAGWVKVERPRWTNDLEAPGARPDAGIEGRSWCRSRAASSQPYLGARVLNPAT